MDAFRFGELRERTLHKQLKALLCPSDGVTEHPVGRSIADIWSPTQGVIEIQTGSLGKLKPKLRSFLKLGRVTVVHPVPVKKVLVTWNADQTEILSQRRSPKVERIENLFREIGSLAEFLLQPGFRLVFCLIHEREHRSADGLGSWRRKGVSRVDRELDQLIDTREFCSADDWRLLLPPNWQGPSTNRELGRLLGLTVAHTQSLTSCFKKMGILEVVGRSGRADLLQLKNGESFVTSGTSTTEGNSPALRAT